MPTTKGVFFDLGGTLFNYPGKGAGGAVRHVVSALGLEEEPENIRAAWLSAMRKTNTQFAAQPYFLHKDLFRETLLRFLEHFDKMPPDGLLESFHQAQLQGIFDHMPIREETHAALSRLKDMGLYVAIVSNIDDDTLLPLIEQHDLAQYLDSAISSEQAQSCKPHSGIFEFALAQANLSAAEVLFVGDSLHHDIAGADAIGMRHAHIINEGIPTPLTDGLAVTAKPTFEIRNLLELIPLIE